MPIRGKYHNYQALAREKDEEVDYIIRCIPRGSGVAIVAPHGGGIEPGTSEIAEGLAGTRHSLYCFEGLRPDGNDDLHITSTRFDEPICLSLLAISSIVLTIHGCEGKEKAVYVGGLHQALIRDVLAELRASGFDAAEDNSHHKGKAPGNLCNRGLRGKGVQLEISEGFRATLFRDLTPRGRVAPTSHYYRFLNAVTRALQKHR